MTKKLSKLDPAMNTEEHPLEMIACVDVRLVAFIDGDDVHLSVETIDGETFYEIAWPHDWPEWVSVGFLQRKGFEVRW